MTSLDYRACILVSVLAGFVGTFAQGPCAGTMGNDPTIDRPEEDTNAADYNFLVLSDIVACHGVIDVWTFWREGGLGVGNCGDLEFQVWRPVDVVTSQYMLVGSNIWTCVPGMPANPVPIDNMRIEDIPVQPGDVYGWTDDRVGNTRRNLGYDTALGGSGTYQQIAFLPLLSCSNVVGDTCDWSPGRREVRGYSLELQLDERPNPYFTNLPATTPVYENVPEGTFVYQARGVNSFTYITVIDPDLTYAINNMNCGGTQFAIDTVTGIITTAGILDFEAGNCWVNVVVQEGPETDTQRLTIDIQDVNEPHYIDPMTLPFTLTLDARTSFTGVIHDVDIIDDALAADNYYFRYTVPVNPPFDIDNNGRVRLRENLPYWSGPTRYVLAVVVEDDYHTAGPEELVIIIENLREPPVILNLDHTATVPENIANGYQVFRVRGACMPDCLDTPAATDNRGDPVTYHITEIYPITTPQDIFQINPNTGWVTYNAAYTLDYFTLSLYQVEIEVRDSPPVPPDPLYTEFVSTKAILTIEITWVNKPPIHLTTVYTSSILEREAIGTPLPDVILDATDRDIPEGDFIVYMLSGAGSHLFYADVITNRVYIIDDIIMIGVYQQSYTLTLDVYDRDGERAVPSATLTITVTDINDHAPVFDQYYYQGSVLETSPGGTYVLTVGAQDVMDGGKNADIRYTILDPLALIYFEVDSVTGIITTKQPIPYDVYPSMTFTVQATDQGDVPLHDNTTVYITILEDNTNTPWFSSPFFSIDLRADTDIGVIIHSVAAADNDSSSVQNISYYWLILDDYYNLGEYNGDIGVARELTAYNKHLLYIAATDGIFYSNDAYTLRVDTYDPEETLVDIYLKLPLADFLLTKAAFLAELNIVLPMWDVRIESERLLGENTVVRIYAVESALPDLEPNQSMEKVFIREGKLVEKLRRNLRGTPSDLLKSPDFAPWQPYKVQPAYPIWIIDTAGGVALLTICCAIFLAGLITMFVLLAKKYGWCCYKNKRSKSSRGRVSPEGGSQDQFKLNYLKHGDEVNHISNNKSLGNTYGGYKGPFVIPDPPFKTKPLYKSESPPKPSSAIRRHTRRASLDDRFNYLPPVEVLRPPSNARPLPQQHWGEAA